MQQNELQASSKKELYEILLAQAESIIDLKCDAITNLSNLSALIYFRLSQLNWAGFYILKGTVLHLGPFQGEVACTRIEVGKGVCGTSVQERKTIVVPNVHEFPGHIACSSASNSEIVIPIFHQGEVYGVIDLDSPVFSNFDEVDQVNLEKLAKIIESKIL